MTAPTIRPEPFDGPVIPGLLAELPWGVGDLTAPEFTPPDGVMLAASLDGAVVGCGGVRRHADGVAEVKRLYVREGARGRGVAVALLHALEDAARDLGYREVRLDTHAEGPAGLFERTGYERIDAYNDNWWAAHWFAKRLA